MGKTYFFSHSLADFLFSPDIFLISFSCRFLFQSRYYIFITGQDAPHSLPSDILSMVPMPTPSMLSASVPECHDLMSGVFRQGHDTLNMLFPEGHDANNSAFLQGFVG